MRCLLQKFVFVFFAVLVSLTVKSQENKTHGNANLFAELAGCGGAYSINYENNLHPFSRSRLAWSAGLSLLPVSGRLSVTLPVGVSYIIGNGKHKAEIGTGQVLVLNIGGGKGGGLRGTMRLGYRFEPENKRYYWLFAYTPFYSYLNNFQYNNWGGVAFGYYFRK